MNHILPGYVEFVASRKKSGAEIVSELTPVNADLFHMAVGIIGEVAEAAKAIYCPKNVENPQCEENLAALFEEFGDTAFYIEGMIQIIEAQGRVFRYELGDIEQEARPALHGALGQAPHAALQIVAGDVLSVIKKSALYGRELDWDKLQTLVTELYNVFWFGFPTTEAECATAPAMARPSNLLQANMDKLTKRYPAGYTNADAVARADKA